MNSQDQPILFNFDQDFSTFLLASPPRFSLEMLANIYMLPDIYGKLKSEKDTEQLEQIELSGPEISNKREVVFTALFRKNDGQEDFFPINSEIPFPPGDQKITTSILDLRLDRSGKTVISARNISKFVNDNFNFQFGGYLFGEPQRSYESILRDLAEIINDPNTLEDDLQNFLEKYPELIMENTYEKVIPQACIVPIGREDEKAWQADFILRPFNQIDFSKILEIKRPQIPIQKREASGHQRFSSKLFDAVQQLRDYESAFNKSEETRKRFKELYNFEVLYPELHLIIGRESQIIDPRAIRAFQHKTNIKIDSWDSFLDKLKKR